MLLTEDKDNGGREGPAWKRVAQKRKSGEGKRGEKSLTESKLAFEAHFLIKSSPPLLFPPIFSLFFFRSSSPGKRVFYCSGGREMKEVETKAEGREDPLGFMPHNPTLAGCGGDLDGQDNKADECVRGGEEIWPKYKRP